MRLVKHSKTRMVFEARNPIAMIVGIGFVALCAPVALGLMVAAMAQFLGLTIHGHPIQEEGSPPIWTGIPCVLFFVAVGLATLAYTTYSETKIFDKTLGILKSERRRLIGWKADDIPLGDIVEVQNWTSEGDSDFATVYWVVLKCSSGQQILINDLEGREEATQLELAECVPFWGCGPTPRQILSVSSTEVKIFTFFGIPNTHRIIRLPSVAQFPLT